MTIIVSITVQLVDGHTSESDKGRIVLRRTAWHGCYLSLEVEALYCSKVVVFLQQRTRRRLGMTSLAHLGGSGKSCALGQPEAMPTSHQVKHQS